MAKNEYEIMQICPICNRRLAMDPDGGYCNFCDEYYSADDLSEYADEYYDDDEEMYDV